MKIPRRDGHRYRSPSSHKEEQRPEPSEPAREHQQPLRPAPRPTTKQERMRPDARRNAPTASRRQTSSDLPGGKTISLKKGPILRRLALRKIKKSNGCGTRAT